jgi:adenosylcobinamide-GDP ribazoletransferase
VAAFFAALTFLTPVRLPQRWTGDERGLRSAPVFFPVVGIVLGGVGAAVMFGLDHILPALPAAVLAALWLVASSAGLHMDGLADTADGLLSSRPRERVLEIMKDSHIGSMGVLAIVGTLLAKVALLGSIPDPSSRWRLVFLAPIAGRCALLLVMCTFRYARPEGGLGTIFRVSGRRAALLAAWALVVLFAAGWLLATYRGLATAGAAAAGSLLLGWYIHRRIGGYTGDTLGATSELVEVLPFLVAAIWMV